MTLVLLTPRSTVGATGTFSFNISTQAQCVTWRDEERVALFQIYSLTAVCTVTQEDVALFAWQHPVLIQRQIVWAWRNQPKDLRNVRQREKSRCDSKLGCDFSSLKLIIHNLLSALILYVQGIYHFHLCTARHTVWSKSKKKKICQNPKL